MRRPILSMLILAGGLQASAQLVVQLKDTVFAGPVGRIADRMIVAFDELAPIGVVQFQEVPSNVFLDGPVGQSLMNSMYQTVSAKDLDREIVLKLGQLRVLQVGSNMQIGMQMEFLELQPTGYARIFEHAVSFTRTNAGRKEIQGMIAHAFQQCLSAFEVSVAEYAGRNEMLDDVQVRAPMERLSSAMKAWNGGTGRAGLYRTYSDFLMDRPDSMEFSTRELVRSLYDDQLVKLRQMDRDTRQDIWGFTDGQHIYKNLGSEFVRLERYEERMVARWKAPAQVDAGAVIAGGLLGGLLGAAVFGGLSSTPGAIIQYELDPLSGDLWPVKERNQRPGYRSVHLFAYSRFAKQDTEIRVQIEGGDGIALNKDQWTIIQPEPRMASATIKVSSDGDMVHVDMDRNARRAEVYLTDMKADGLLSVKRLPEQMARKKIDTLKAEQRR